MTKPDDLTVTRYPVAELRTYYRNPRQGDVAAIQQSLRVNGMYRPICVNSGTHTGRANEVLTGNHTLMAAREEGWENIQAVTVDVDEDQAARIVAADNRTADKGHYDDRLLAELLGDLDDLSGTGYDPGDLDNLLANLNPASDADWAEALDGAGGGENGPETITRTFTLHSSQAELVDKALGDAAGHVTPEHEEFNSNSNGNRLVVLAEHFLRGTT